jgi:hypothetical protein
VRIHPRELVWGGWDLSLVRDRRGRPELAIAMVRDLTEMKRSDHERRFFQFMFKLIGEADSSHQVLTAAAQQQLIHDLIDLSRVGRLPVVTGDPVGFRQLFTNRARPRARLRRRRAPGGPLVQGRDGHGAGHLPQDRRGPGGWHRHRGRPRDRRPDRAAGGGRRPLAVPGADPRGAPGTTWWLASPGRTWARPGNFDGNEFFDLAVGAPLETVAGRPSAGAVDARDGADGGLPAAPDEPLYFQGNDGVPGTAESGGLFAVALSA